MSHTNRCGYSFKKWFWRYIDIQVNICITLVIEMSVAVSVRLPEKIIRDLEVLASTIERSITFIVRKAIESYLKNYADYLVALERLRDKDDEIISSEELREQLGL